MSPSVFPVSVSISAIALSPPRETYSSAPPSETAMEFGLLQPSPPGAGAGGVGIDNLATRGLDSRNRIAVSVGDVE